MNAARYIRRDARIYAHAGCRACGTAAATGLCAVAVCAACGTPQCHGNGLARGTCAICYIGLLPGWSGYARPCGYKGCAAPAVAAEAPRVGNVCKAHLERAKYPAAYGHPAESAAARIVRRLAERDRGWVLFDPETGLSAEHTRFVQGPGYLALGVAR